MLRSASSLVLFALLTMQFMGCQNSQLGSESSTNSSTATDNEPQQQTEEETSPEQELVNTPLVPAEESEAVPFEYVNPLTPEQQAAGWISLFDGISLFGWESTDEKIDWTVSDGAIVAEEGPIGFLMTKVPFQDYELVCEYRIASDGNSGLFLRTEFPPGNISTDCYEVNIAASHPDGFTTGSLVNRKKTDAPSPIQDGWNELRVTLNGNAATVEHNGATVLEYAADNNVAAHGRIGLQKNSGKIEFRKLILKPLNTKSLFNGKDLTGWREVPGSKSEFKVVDGEIQVKNGLGFIETEETYQDFLFQADAISHAAELNSGFFFRAMKGTEEAPSNGYEYQIHNGFKEARIVPSNAGTGAIFRRVDARYVVANDKEWFTSTLVANGPRIACWVNGYQVVDWEDDRKPDPNPRRGLRLEGGHISIQGHDPTTDLSFKNLKVAPYAKGSGE